MVKLGVLDYAHIDEGKTPQQGLEQTLQLAQHADQLGYHRFWVAEHHNLPAFSSSSPELLMMRLADATHQIRLGSGGVMLPHYSPFKVAENFRVLEGFHPGRIDLGIGNTTGTEIVNQALNETKKSKLSYERSIKDVYHYLTNNSDPNHRFQDLWANPVLDTLPELWLLSSSVRSAKMAARLGLAYTFGLFPYASEGKLEVAQEATETYRQNFQPSQSIKKPKTMIAMFIAVSDDALQAEAKAKALDLWLLGKGNFGKLTRFPSQKTVQNYQYTDEDLKHIEQNRSRLISGHIDEVEKELQGYIDVTKADEVLIIPLMEGIDNRKKALDLIYQRFGH